MVRALGSHQCGLGSIPGPGVTYGLSLLLVLVLAPEVFLRVLRFSPLLKNQHLQIPIRSSFSPISSAVGHGYKIETIIKLFDAKKRFKRETTPSKWS